MKCAITWGCHDYHWSWQQLMDIIGIKNYNFLYFLSIVHWSVRMIDVLERCQCETTFPFFGFTQLLSLSLYSTSDWQVFWRGRHSIDIWWGESTVDGKGNAIDVRECDAKCLSPSFVPIVPVLQHCSTTDPLACLEERPLLVYHSLVSSQICLCV